MKHNCKMLIYVTVSVVALAIALGGCISTSHQADLLSKYQQLMTHATGNQPVNGRIISQPKLLKSAAGEFLPVKKSQDAQDGKMIIELSLPEAVQRALANSPEIMLSSFDPAISREQITAYEAQFDAVFNSSFTFGKGDAQSNYGSVIGRNKTGTFETKLSKRFITGAAAELSYTLERSRTYNPSYFNDPNYSSRTAFKLTQPLLRDFGPAVNTAQIRVARINHKISLQAFRSQVLSKLEEIQALYWRLAQAHEDVKIQKRLLLRTQNTYEHVEARSELDASRIQITDARAAVESSRLLLVQAQKLVGDVQDNFIKAIGDPSLQLMGDFTIIPTTGLSDAKLKVDTAEKLATALKNNPDFDQLRRDMKIRDIAIDVQENQALPRLDVTAGMAYNGAVSDNAKDSWDQMAGGDYIDYSVGMSFEWPLGNRQRNAELRIAKYNRGKSIANMQATADELAIGISATVRTLEYSYKEIQIGRDNLLARRDNLDALEARLQTVQAMTPSFLNQLLGAQQSLASAERAVYQALIDYNTSQASLAKLTGTAMREMGVIVQDDDDVLDLLNSYVELTGAGEDTHLPTDDSSEESEDDEKPDNEKENQDENNMI